MRRDDERVREVPIEHERGPIERERGTLERDREAIERDRGIVERDREAINRERAQLERDRAQMVERDRGIVERDRGIAERDRGIVEREHHGGAHTAFLIGRILLGGYFLFNAFNHFANVGMMSGYAASKGIPAPNLAVILSGILLLVAGVSFLLGWRPWVGVLAVALFLIPVTFFMHAFWKTADPIARQLDLVNFAKNIALLGAALMLLAIPRPWPWTVASIRARRQERRRLTPQPA